MLLVLSTTTGIRLAAIWKPKMDKWYIVEIDFKGDLKNIIDILTPRQFQDAFENGQYSFSW